MADTLFVSKINLNSVVYDIKDEVARQLIAEIDTSAIIVASTAPTDTTKLWRSTADSKLRYYDGTEWKVIGGNATLELYQIKIKTPPTKTSYKAGETFNPAGMVVAADYAIGGIVIREDVTVTGWTYEQGALAAGKTSIKISYSETGVTKEVNQSITVTKTQLTKPTWTGSLTYNGQEQTPTFNNENPTYVTKGGTYKATNANTSPGYQATFTIKNTSYYEWSDGSTSPVSVTWTIAKATPTLSLSPSSIILDNDHHSVTATITTNSDGAIIASCRNTSIATVTRTNKTIIVASNNETAGDTYIDISVAATTNYNAKSIAASLTASFVYVQKIYGVSWDGTSDPKTSFSRTDDAADFVDPVPYLSGMTAAQCSSPFDNIMPWAGMQKTTDSAAGVLVAIPKFYYKLVQSGSGMTIQITDSPKDGFSVSPAHMARGTNHPEKDVVYVGRYHCATSTYKSTTNVMPQASVTRANFRSSIHNLGTNIYQLDLATRFTIWLLYLVEFANFDSQTAIGGGCSPSGSVDNMGKTDSMPYHTGTTATSRGTPGSPVYGWTQYRNIEGLWDNVYDWLDGCYYNSSGLNVILNPDSFSDSTGGTLIGKPSSGYPTAFSVSSSGGFSMFYPTTASGSSSTFSCDNWYFSASNPCLYAGGSYNQDANRGLFCVYRNGASGASDYHGARLMKL